MKECDLQLTLGRAERRYTELSTYGYCMGRGAGSSNLGQTQVELIGLNRMFHELGPQVEWLSTYTDSLTCQVIYPPTGPVSVGS